MNLIKYIFKKYTFRQLYYILFFHDQDVFEQKLLQNLKDGVRYRLIVRIRRFYFWLYRYFKNKNKIVIKLPLSKEELQKNYNSLLTFNQQNFSKLPKIQMNIVIHSIKSKSDLIRTIKSTIGFEFPNIKIRKFFLNSCKYEIVDINEIKHRDLQNKRGEFLFFLRAGDMLDDLFFLEVYKFICRDLNKKVIYFNELRAPFDNKLKQIVKPCFSPDYLENYNYIGSNFIVAKKFEKELCNLKKDNNFHKFLLNISTAVDTKSISLLNKFLIKSRYFQTSKSNDHAKNITAALRSYHKKMGISTKINIFKGQPLITYKNFNPFVSIIIPASGNFYKGKDLLLVLLDSIFKITDYNNYEIIIIDHDDLNSEHLNIINSSPNIKRIKLKKLSSVNDFNFSRNCNISANYARGDYLLFLNDDMKVINSSWLSELVGHFIKPHTGIVGGKLLFSNNKLQHAGVGLLDGNPGHLYENKPHDFHAANITKNLLAVTGACLMIKKEFFYNVGCFDETIFRTNYSDTDLCLKVISKLNKYVIYEPKCQLYHFASVSRADAYSNVSPDDISNFQDKWGFLLYDEFVNSIYLANLNLMTPKV
jgi:GT2 family glycosyltransferase